MLVQRTPTTTQEYVVEIGAKQIKMWPLRARLAESAIESTWGGVYVNYQFNRGRTDREYYVQTGETQSPVYLVQMNKLPPGLRRQLLDGDWLTEARIK